MSAEVSDITPPDEPIALARDMVAEAPGCIAAVCALVRADGTLWMDCCGHERHEILWALQKMIHILMEHDGE